MPQITSNNGERSSEMLGWTGLMFTSRLLLLTVLESPSVERPSVVWWRNKFSSSKIPRRRREIFLQVTFWLLLFSILKYYLDCKFISWNSFLVKYIFVALYHICPRLVNHRHFAWNFYTCYHDPGPEMKVDYVVLVKSQFGESVDRTEELE